jgi:lipoate-protein ligase B
LRARRSNGGKSLAGSNSPDRRALHLWLGRADYGWTLELQRTLHARRRAGVTPDVVITVEHNPVITFGRSGSREHLLASPNDLRREGIEVFEVERGGDVTYHGPGQLVVYPIVDLRDHGRDVRGFVRGLEDATIATLTDLEIAAGRRDGYPGVWASERKIASIGVYVSGWVSRHGLAVNVAVNPAHFAMIRPCGLPVETVSIRDLVGQAVRLDRVRDVLLDRLAERFGWAVEASSLAEILGEASE